MCPKYVFIGKPLKINCPKEVKIKKSIYISYIRHVFQIVYFLDFTIYHSYHECLSDCNMIWMVNGKIQKINTPHFLKREMFCFVLDKFTCVVCICQFKLNYAGSEVENSQQCAKQHQFGPREIRNIGNPHTYFFCMLNWKIKKKHRLLTNCKYESYLYLVFDFLVV